MDDPLLIDRRPEPGKKCTGVVSRETYKKLEIGKEYIDREFKDIVLKYKKYEIWFKVDVVRIDRSRLEKDLYKNLRVMRHSNATIISRDLVSVNGVKIKGRVIDASGWKGKCTWTRAIELEGKPIDQDYISVFFNEKNPGGFSWVVPLPDRTLYGAITAVGSPLNFIPYNDRSKGVHGGAIPRVYPPRRPSDIIRIGDSTGLIKTFTGGGFFSIAELLNPTLNALKKGDRTAYDSTYSRVSKEVRRQYVATKISSSIWSPLLGIFRILNGKSIRADREFDLHTAVVKLLLSN
ncbi:MAG: NAD(P)/FAD-dependent oxidoreductase [Sulfolobus sp.]|nr:NAD(P)/FAD-dependent oxidoreductase [Sulfolobus sp.]